MAATTTIMRIFGFGLLLLSLASPAATAGEQLGIAVESPDSTLRFRVENYFDKKLATVDNLRSGEFSESDDVRLNISGQWLEAEGNTRWASTLQSW